MLYTLRTEKPQSNERNYPPRTSTAREKPLTNSRSKLLQPLGTSGNPSNPTALHFIPLASIRPTPWFSELVDDYKTAIDQQTRNCRRYGLTTQNSNVQKGIHCPSMSIPVKLLQLHSVYSYKSCRFRNWYFHRWKHLNLRRDGNGESNILRGFTIWTTHCTAGHGGRAGRNKKGNSYVRHWLL